MSLADRTREWWTQPLEPTRFGMLQSGLAPIPPSDRIFILFKLALSPGPYQHESLGVLQKLDPRDAEFVLRENDVPAELIDFFVQLFADEEILLKCLRHQNIHPHSIRLIIQRTQAPRILEVLSEKHSHLEHDQDLVQWILAHPGVPAYQKNILASIYPHLVAATPAPSRPSSPPMEASKPQPMTEESTGTTSTEDMPDSEVEKFDHRIRNLRKELDGLTIGQKIALGMKGNKETRDILLGQPELVVLKAVLENPKISEDEIVQIAADRTMDTDILRTISLNRTWMRNSAVRNHLVRNPKTPLGIALGLLGSLGKSELENISKSKNISAALRTQAEKILKTRS